MNEKISCYCSECRKVNRYELGPDDLVRDEHGIAHLKVNLVCEYCGAGSREVD